MDLVQYKKSLHSILKAFNQGIYGIEEVENYIVDLVLKTQYITIPDNDVGITKGYYDPVALLRDNKDKPEVITFIADMLEK